MVARKLLSDMLECIQGLFLLELVDHHHIGEVEHVDLLQLRRRSELRGHDIDGSVAHLGDGGVALADTAGLHDDKVIARSLHDVQRVMDGIRKLVLGCPGGHGAHIDPLVIDLVHAYPVAQQCTTAA